MEKRQAQEFINQVLNSRFDREQFELFVRNLLNEYEPKNNNYSGKLIPEAFRDHIAHYKRIGKYTDPNGEELDILIVQTSTVKKLERARTALRNFVVRHLKNFEKHYALVAFYSKEDHGAEWRLSLVKIDYALQRSEKGKIEVKEDLVPARRFSFLVGENEDAYTAQKQLLPLLLNDRSNPLIAAEKDGDGSIEGAFSVEKVTEEFYQQYKELFLKLSENQSLIRTLQKEGLDPVRFVKKLLGQIVFLYFLQKKGWLGVPKEGKMGEGSKRFLQDRFERINEKGLNYFNDFLRYLFYSALAHEHHDEGIKYYFKQLECKIPFLNGGLFEAEYDWENAELDIPNSYFRNHEKNKAGDKGTGILDVFDRYNFTIKEDEPLEKEVAVDPEMLGKVFENLLEVKDRKSKGAFYTPREIVHYMCRESLIHYLDNCLNADSGDEMIKKEDIEQLIRYGHLALEHETTVAGKGKETRAYRHKLPESVRTHAGQLDQALADIKICDPAIGSGAFPVGMLQEIVTARLVLNSFLQNNDHTPYQLKRHAIQNSIYGVDIDASAIDIARLRLWLSMIVDEEDYDTIEALPNLDYKIVCGNSLISRYPLEVPINNVFREFNKRVKSDDYSNTVIKEMVGGKDIDLAYYKKLDKEFLQESTHEKKKVFRELINEIKRAFIIYLGKEQNEKVSKARGILINLQIKDIFGNQVGSKDEIKKAEKRLMELQQARQKIQEGVLYKNAVEWRFEFPDLLDDEGNFVGFDVVIGNPPYIQLQKAFDDQRKYADLYKEMNYRTFERTGDIYALFYEKGLDILHEGSHLCYITSNKWMRANYGKSLRKLLAGLNPKILIDLGPGIFSTATVDTNILLVQKTKSRNTALKAITLTKDKYLDQLSDSDFTRLCRLSEESWIILSPAEQKIKQRIEQVGTPLKDWDINIYRGVLTGYNQAFIIDGKTKDRLIAQDPKSAEIIKPILRGRDIKRYKAEFADLWLINAHNGYVNSDGKRIPSIDINDYPAIKEHLDQYWEQLKKRQDKGVTPYNLRNCAYLEEFEKEKIIYPNMTKYLPFYYDKTKSLTNQKCFILTGSELKYLMGYFNSEISHYLIKQNFPELQGGTRELSKVFFIYHPVPKISAQFQVPFEALVDYILLLKEQGEYDKSVYFEQLIDGMVYELYFEEEIKKAGCEIFKHLGDLKPIDDKMSDEEKLAIIQSEYARLSHPDHPVRRALERLDEVEEVRIIRKKLEI